MVTIGGVTVTLDPDTHTAGQAQLALKRRSPYNANESGKEPYINNTVCQAATTAAPVHRLLHHSKVSSWVLGQPHLLKGGGAQR